MFVNVTKKQVRLNWRRSKLASSISLKQSKFCEKSVFLLLSKRQTQNHCKYWGCLRKRAERPNPVVLEPRNSSVFREGETDY